MGFFLSKITSHIQKRFEKRNSMGKVEDIE